jgi:hypothetical protein
MKTSSAWCLIWLIGVSLVIVIGCSGTANEGTKPAAAVDKQADPQTVGAPSQQTSKSVSPSQASAQATTAAIASEPPQQPVDASSLTTLQKVNSADVKQQIEGAREAKQRFGAAEKTEQSAQ